MFRNYLAAALRNLSRNRLYAGITIAGLAVGLAAAMLIGLFVRDELTYDRWVPDHDRVFMVMQTLALANSKPIETENTPIMMAPRLKLEFPQIQYVARMAAPGFPVVVRRGEIVGSEEHMYWADPDFFRVLPMPAVAGIPTTALDTPDGAVLTQAIARKYFGRENVVGESLLMNGRPYRVTAVVKDLPSNTHLTAQMWVSSLGPVGPIAQYGSLNLPLANMTATYVKLKPGVAAADLVPRFPAFLQNRVPIPSRQTALAGVKRVLHFVPLTRIHTTPTNQGSMKPRADPAILGGIGLVGLLIVVVAAINFVTLMTARASRRAVEVGVRKAVGASRSNLFTQFMGEAALYVLAATVLALSLAELLMPAVDAFLQSRLKLDYLHDPALGATILVCITLTALLAGAYPALILSSFRPSSVLKGGPAPASGGSGVRQALVVGQFAVLIGLFLVAVTIARQTRFALNEGMRVDKEQVLLLFSQPCMEPVRDEARRLPGVKVAACASFEALNRGDNRDIVPLNGRNFDISFAPVDFGFFEAFGLKPLAGRLFDPARPGDGVRLPSETLAPVILNETAVRLLGFASPQAAIGHTVPWHGIWYDNQFPTSPGPWPSEIIGVVPDFTFGSLRQEIRPMLYQIGKEQAPHSIAMVLKLDGKRLPETLASIDALWKRLGQGKPELRIFVQDYQQRLYTDTIIQGGTIAMAAGIALSVACLGLFALSAFTAERRTKEIGIRKAMGASSADILKLLLWQFTKAVLWAIVIALPAAYLVMQWWLKGFVYHVSPALWTFAAAAIGAIVIAWITVFTQTWRVARAKPVSALRYE